MTMDFTPSPHAAFSAAFEDEISAAVAAKRQAADEAYRASAPDAMRPAIGAGRLGNECLRALGYEFFRTPKDPDRGFTGRNYRIFDRGHDAEERMAEYLRAAGITLLTERPSDGKQFRFDICRYEDGKGRIKGMIDGVVTAVPDHIAEMGLRTPCVWENKELGNKGWTKLKRSGLRGYGGDYYSQVQLNMNYLDLRDNPALFTAKNADTQEIYSELVPFDAAAAQAASDRGARVVSSLAADELPRIGKEPTDFRCKFCDYARRCWNLDAPEPAPGDVKPWNWGDK